MGKRKTRNAKKRKPIPAHCESPQSETNENPQKLLQYIKGLDNVPEQVGNVSPYDTPVATPQLSTSAHGSSFASPSESRKSQDELLSQMKKSMECEVESIGGTEEFEAFAPIANHFGLPTLKELENQDSSLGILREYPFMHKLYLAACNADCHFLCWSSDGQDLQIGYVGLQEHLFSQRSIFNSRSVSHFIQLLCSYGFERKAEFLEVPPDCDWETYVNNATSAQWDLICLVFVHPNFKRADKSFLLVQLHPKPTELKEQSMHFFMGSAMPAHNDRMRTRADLCSAILGERSDLQLARARLDALARFQLDLTLLPSNNSEILANTVPRRGRLATKTLAEKDVPKRMVKQVMPQESLLAFADGYAPEYAGYYGNISTALINDFFADSMPRYGRKTSGFKEILKEGSSKVSTFQQNLPIGISYSEDEEELGLEDLKPAVRSSSKRKQPKLSKPDDQELLFDDMELEQAMELLCGAGEAEHESLLKPKSHAKSAGSTRTVSMSPVTTVIGANLAMESVLKAAALAAAEAETKNLPEDNQDILNILLDTPTKKAEVINHPSTKRTCYGLRGSKRNKTK